MKKVMLRFISFVDAGINILILAIFAVLIIYCVYVFADSGRVESEADVAHFAQYKPVESEHLTFSQLQEKNPDVFGWITIDDTGVDYPLLQGHNNSEYVNKSPDKKFSLTGSIFLDYRNDNAFTDRVSVIYGHHMEKDRLFGCFDKYEDASFFNEHKTGTVIFDDKSHRIDIFAFFHADGYDTDVYDPYVDDDGFDEWLSHIEEISVIRGDFPESGSNVVLLSTCASMETNMRLVLAATLSEGVPLPVESGSEGITVLWVWFIAPAVIIAAVLIAIKEIRRRRKQSDRKIRVKLI